MKTITLCYRKVIDASTTGPWEQLVFEATYREFRMQAQYFNQENRCRSFSELLQHAPGAGQLHFLVSAAVRGYLQQLNGLVPDVLDNLGRQFLKFTRFQFEIINSDLLDQNQHRVAVNFFSDPLHWHDTIGDLLLVSDPAAPSEVDESVPTHLFRMPPFLAIHTLKTSA